MPKTKKPLTKAEREKKKLAEERKARRKAELEAIMASDNPPKIHVYKHVKPYKDGWHYVYERRMVHVKLLGKRTSVELNSIVIGKLPPGETDISKMIPTGDTGPKGEMKRRKAQETGTPLYKAPQKPSGRQKRIDGSRSNSCEAAAENPTACGEEATPRPGEQKESGTREQMPPVRGKTALENREQKSIGQDEVKLEIDALISQENPIIPFTDTRDPGKVIYPAYLVLLVLMMCAGLGFASTRQIAEFWRAYREDLARLFKDFPDRDISHDTVRNFYIALGKCDTNLLLEQFNAMLLLEAGVWDDINKNATAEEKAAFQRTVLALDGQAIRASKIEVGKSTAKCCLSVYDTSCSIVQAQELVGEKTNEIPHARSLLRRIDIRHAIITADAMHTQVELLGCIIEDEADYCMAVKGNQPKTLDDIRRAFGAPKNERLVKTFTRHDKGHGRYETRVIDVLPSSVLEPETVEKWPGLANGSIVRVTSTRLEDATDKKSIETRYFISSLRYDLDWIAPWLLTIIRRHWCIENKLHWVLDVTYGQDYVNCKDDEFLSGVTTLNKLMYNFTSAAQCLLSRERGKKVSMRSLKPHFGSVSSFLKLIAKVCVAVSERTEGGENAKPSNLSAP